MSGAYQPPTPADEVHARDQGTSALAKELAKNRELEEMLARMRRELTPSNKALNKWIRIGDRIHRLTKECISLGYLPMKDPKTLDGVRKNIARLQERFEEAAARASERAAGQS